MKILTDCIYLPAQKPPKSCQDYAICSGENDKYPFLIICDGCGSSKDTDIGARLLAHGAKSYFKKIIQHANRFDYKEFGLASIINAHASSKILDINTQCLDATLIVSYILDNSIFAFMYGDGYIFSTGKNGIINRYKQVSYKGNAPHYLSYHLNDERYLKYKDQLGPDPVMIQAGEFTTDDPKILYMDTYLEKPIVSIHNVGITEAFLIASDGIDSFIEIGTGNKVCFQEVMNQLTSFKTKKGEFIKRRVRRMMEDYAKKGIYNYDDVSIAAFMVMEE